MADNTTHNRHDNSQQAITALNDFIMSRTKASAVSKNPNSFPIFDLSYAYPPCILPSQNLTKILLQDLSLEHHHRGSSISLRIVTSVFRTGTGNLEAMAQDEAGNVTIVELFQQEGAGRSTKDIMDKGMSFMVKEPYYKMLNKKEAGICVDHISDIIRLQSNIKDDLTLDPASEGEGDDLQPHLMIKNHFPVNYNKLTTPTTILRRKGDQAMRDNKYYEAIDSYSLAINCESSEYDIENMRRERGLAFLKTGQFDAAIIDFDCPKYSLTKQRIILLAKAQALYDLQRFQECCDVLDALHNIFSKNQRSQEHSIRVDTHLHWEKQNTKEHEKVAQEFLRRAKLRLEEQNTGRYNFEKMYNEAMEMKVPILDHATFIGPVEVKQIPCHGRGHVTSRNVEAGELLLCEKAFAYCCNASATDGQAGMNLGAGDLKSYLTRVIIHKLSNNPSLIPKFTALWSGDYKSVPAELADGVPVIDTFLISQIVNFNCWDFPHSTREVLECTENKDYRSTAMFIMASYINHACMSNCRSIVIGDMHIVRATRDLPAGTELRFLYAWPSSTDDYTAIQKNFQHWKFTCDCGMCIAAKNTSGAFMQRRLESRERAFSFLQDLEHTEHINMEYAEDCLYEMELTYPMKASSAPRIAAAEVGIHIAREFCVRGEVSQRKGLIAKGKREMRKVFLAASKVLENLGFIIEKVEGEDDYIPRRCILHWGIAVHGIVECMAVIWSYHLLNGTPELAQQFQEFAKTAYRIIYGEDETFETEVGAKVRESVGKGVMWSI